MQNVSKDEKCDFLEINITGHLLAKDRTKVM